MPWIFSISRNESKYNLGVFLRHAALNFVVSTYLCLGGNFVFRTRVKKAWGNNNLLVFFCFFHDLAPLRHHRSGVVFGKMFHVALGTLHRLGR